MVGFLGLLIVRLLLVSPSRPGSSSVRVSLISDLPVAGRYSASVSSSCRLGRRLRLRLRLRLVRLVLSFSRAFRSPWGFVVSLRSATTVAWVPPSHLPSSVSSLPSSSWSSCSSASSSTCAPCSLVLLGGSAMSTLPYVWLTCAFGHNKRGETQLVCWCAFLESAWCPAWNQRRRPGAWGGGGGEAGAYIGWGVRAGGSNPDRGHGRVKPGSGEAPHEK